MSLLKTVSVVVTLGGSVASPKYHSNVGVGISDGRGKGAIRFAEHVSEYVSPAFLVPEEEMVTGVSTVLVFPKSTIQNSISG